MTFFDKKEEVMKVELTPYGRYLLSIGKLRPKFYRFFDENIVYDSNAIGFDEPQNNVHIRVIDETPILKQNPNITGVETNIRKFDVPEVSARFLRVPSLDDSINSNNESIGTNNYTSKDASNFDVKLFNSSFIEESMSNVYSTPNVASIAIPQLPINFYFSSSIKTNESLDQDNNVFNNIGPNEIQSNLFGDDKFFSIQGVEPLIYIKELNSFDTMDNFYLTAFKIQSSSLGITYSKLRISEQTQRVVNGILTDEPVVSAGLFEGFGTDDYLTGETQTTDDLEYYLDITIDRQIPNEDVCAAIGDLKVKNIYLDEELNCPEFEIPQPFELYSTRVGVEDLEDCD